MSTSFSPESPTTRTADSFLGEGIPNETADHLSNSFLEGKVSSKEGSLEDSFLRGADKDREGSVAKLEKSFEQSHPEVPSDRPVHGLDLKESYETYTNRLPEFAEYASSTDPTLNKHIERVSTKMRDARESGNFEEIPKLIDEIYRDCSGRFAEVIVAKSMAPYFEKISIQKIADGHGGITKIDVLCEGAKTPLHLNGGVFVPKGGSLAVEVKAAKEDYFKRELQGHLLHQVEGHKIADSGMVVSTKDIKEAYKNSSSEIRDNARGILREAGSPLFCFLPSKGDLDKAMLEEVQRRCR